MERYLVSFLACAHLPVHPLALLVPPSSIMHNLQTNVKGMRIVALKGDIVRSAGRKQTRGSLQCPLLRA